MGRVPPAGRRVTERPVDAVWLVLLPATFLFELGYGLFSVVYEIPQLAPPGVDRAGAQWFAVAVAVSAAVGLVGSLTTLLKRHDGIELIGCAGIVACMVFYFLTLTVLTGTADPYRGGGPGGMVRPGTAFVPAVFGLVPALRLAAIVRDRAGRRRT